MSSDSLCGDDKKRYIRNVQLVYGVLGSAEAQHSLNYFDPYQLPAESRVDDIPDGRESSLDRCMCI